MTFDIQKEKKDVLLWFDKDATIYAMRETLTKFHFLFYFNLFLDSFFKFSLFVCVTRLISNWNLLL